MTGEEFDLILSRFLKHVEKSDIPGWQGLCENIKESKNAIFNRYNNLKDYTKEKFMEKKQDEEQLLDRHKCAACLIISFMEGLKIKEYAGNDCLIRERLSLSIGLMLLRFVIITDILEDKGVTKNQNLIKFLEKRGGFLFQNTICDQNNVPNNWLSELHFALKEDKLFILSQSKDLFSLEMHNMVVADVMENLSSFSVMETFIKKYTMPITATLITNALKSQ
jgi:hypothetical protein